MSSLIFAHAKSIYNKAQKHASCTADIAYSAEQYATEEERKKIYHDTFQKNYELVIKTERKKFADILQIATVLHEDYIAITGSVTNQWYFITIRPDCSKVSFNEFYDKIEKLTERKCFKQFSLSFEQKGTSDETLGEGFHVHIVSEMTFRSKPDCIRGMLSSFNKWINKEYIAEQCIDVQVSSRPEELIQGYLIDYKHSDKHKIATKEWDMKWREALNLKPIYKDEVPKRASLTVTSPVTVKDVSIKNIKITANPTVSFQ